MTDFDPNDAVNGNVIGFDHPGWRDATRTQRVRILQLTDVPVRVTGADGEDKILGPGAYLVHDLETGGRFITDNVDDYDLGAEIPVGDDDLSRQRGADVDAGTDFGGASNTGEPS